LDTYISRAATFARKLQHHPFWLDSYGGSLKRKEAYQASFLLFLMEQEQGVVNLSVEKVVNLASGAFDAEMTAELYEQVDMRLAMCQHVFAGASMHNMTDIIPMYQAAVFLAKEGISLFEQDRGCLASWLIGVLNKSRWGGEYGFASPVYRLRQMHVQRDFWHIHLPRLIETFRMVSVA